MKKGLGELKQFLPWNYRKQVADTTGYCRQYVYLVATGKLTNWKMLDTLIAMAEDNKKIHNKLNNSNKRISKKKK